MNIVCAVLKSNINKRDSTNIFEKSYHLQEVDVSYNTTKYHDIKNVCRICGGPAMQGVDIFSDKGVELKLKEKINLHMPISIDTVDPSTPQRICTDCCNNLEITHLLIVSCLRTDMRLKRLLNFAGEVRENILIITKFYLYILNSLNSFLYIKK